MFAEPFVLADQDRVEQFAALARGNRILGGFEVWQDAHDVVWARKRVGDHCFAVSLLGPGWTFDPYAQQRRAENLAERRSLMESAAADRQQQDLDRIVSALRFGPIAERVLWAIHRRVMQARQSLVRLPDRRLARLIWGAGDRARPHHWRKTLREVFEGLAWLHVAAWPEDVNTSSWLLRQPPTRSRITRTSGRRWLGTGSRIPGSSGLHGDSCRQPWSTRAASASSTVRLSRAEVGRWKRQPHPKLFM